MTISLFSPIHSNCQHPQENCSFLRLSNSIFNWGQKAYEIKLYTGGSSLELIEIKGSRPSFMDVILRIVSYMTIIIPLIMLIGTLIYRALNNFVISSKKDIFEEKDINKHIVCQLTVKEISLMRGTSHLNKAIAECELIARLNLEKISPSDFGIRTVTDLINYFGGNCSEIFTLDLRDFPQVNDDDLGKLLQFFPKLIQLFLKEAQITDESARSFSQMLQLEKLALSKCVYVNDFSFLQELKKLTSLNLSGCNKDFSFLQSLQGLKSLDLSGCDPFVDYSFLQNIRGLEKLNLSKCFINEDFSFLHSLKRLKELKLTSCLGMTDLSVLNGSAELKSLDLSRCTSIKDCTPLQNFKKLEELTLAYCSQLSDLSFLQDLQSLKKLNLMNCDKITDISLLQLLPNLNEVDLRGVYVFNDISYLQRQGVKVILEI